MLMVASGVAEIDMIAPYGINYRVNKYYAIIDKTQQLDHT